MIESAVYIDEAGDLGSNRGTRWFVLSAVIVDKSDEPIIRSKMESLKNRLNIKTIHLRDIKDFYKRALITKVADDFRFTYVNVITDTNLLDPERLSANAAYNFQCKILLERVSWFLKDTGRTADIVLSARGTSRDSELTAYITDKLLPYPHNNIESSYIRKVSAKSAGSWDLLQLADICATTTFLAHEINACGFRTPCFLRALQHHLYNRSGEVMSYGLKYYLSSGDIKEDVLSCEWPCKKKEPSVRLPHENHAG